eukprot:PhM_4_TR9789/c0_g1_i1/m.40548
MATKAHHIPARISTKQTSTASKTTPPPPSTPSPSASSTASIISMAETSPSSKKAPTMAEKLSQSLKAPPPPPSPSPATTDAANDAPPTPTEEKKPPSSRNPRNRSLLGGSTNLQLNIVPKDLQPVVEIVGAAPTLPNAPQRKVKYSKEAASTTKSSSGDHQHHHNNKSVMAGTRGGPHNNGRGVTSGNVGAGVVTGTTTTASTTAARQAALCVMRNHADDRSPVSFASSHHPHHHPSSGEHFSFVVTRHGVRLDDTAETTNREGTDATGGERRSVRFSDLIHLSVIDRGQQGEVSLVLDQRSGKHYAVKKIDLLLLRSNNASARAVERKALQVNIQRELSMLACTETSQYVIQVLNAYFEEPYLHILMEYAEYSLSKLCKVIGVIRPDVIEQRTQKHFRQFAMIVPAELSSSLSSAPTTTTTPNGSFVDPLAPSTGRTLATQQSTSPGPSCAAATATGSSRRRRGTQMNLVGAASAVPQQQQQQQ